MSGHVFVDESKRRDFVLVAGAVLPGSLVSARDHIRQLYLPGQNGIHMVKEHESRQRAILRAITQIDVEITVYVAQKRVFSSEREARRRCIEELVSDIASHGWDHLCLERDDSLAAEDRRIIHRRLGQLSYRDRLHYTHSKVTSEPLLAIPDAVAWAWPQRRWRAACEMVTNVRQV